MSDNYIAGEFYDKYYIDQQKKDEASHIIEKESSWIVRIIQEYVKTLKKVQKQDKNNRDEHEYDGISKDCHVAIKMAKDIENNPESFTENLKKSGQDVRFLHYVISFDRRNKEHQTAEELRKEFQRKEFEIKCTALIAGMLLAYLFQQLIISL